MNTTSRVAVLNAIENMGASVCAYSMPGRGWAKTCDCKYGANKLFQRSERGNGCPELRCAHLAMSRMTDAEWDALMYRTRPTSGAAAGGES